MRSAVLCSYVGNMYMAEALVATDRIADAISHLNPEALTLADVSTVPPEAKADPGWLMMMIAMIVSNAP